ncbi:MAG: phosphate acyltransferase PlsX [Planctomycetota bacterium]|nr:phosphate acyltransferase PlsX [Planctomycetota bacterium]
MRIGVDAMGGDFAPAGVVKGALEAERLLSDEDRIVLLGDESSIREHLDASCGWERFVQIEHAGEVIGMDESPVEALRQKPDSSISKMASLAARGRLDAMISAGNTGACVAAAQMRLRRLRGVHRPGIAIVTPTYAGPVVMCDVGANVNCRPRHLYQYGLMSVEYSRCICGIDKPRVALLSIGAEDAKGNQLVKETRDLFKNDPEMKFVGNVEGRDMFHGACDVVVTEGFVGNVALKLMEGLAEGLFKSTYLELTRSNPELAGRFEHAITTIRDKYDFNEYGGAPLLGVNGICIICHGASRAKGITNAIGVALSFAETHINDRITECLIRRGQSGDDL